MTPKLTKRNSYLEWEEYFMAIAFLSAQRSKDPRTQVGACIVNQDKKIVGIGYNGMPIGCDDDAMPWNKANDENEESWLQSKTPYVCHAELNAVLNKNLADIKGCIIYVALFPCNMCSQIIIQSGIKEVVYYSDKYHDQAKFKASRFLLDTAKVKYRQFRPRQKNIVIDFDCIEETENQVINTSDHKIQCLNPQEMKKTNEDSVPFGSEILRNGQAGESLEVNINCNSKNKYLSGKKECVGMPINNNNKGTPKVYKLEDQMGQQHLQLHQDDEPTALQMAPSPASPDVRDELLEFKFAAVSTVVIVFVAFFSWYLSHCKLVISNSA